MWGGTCHLGQIPAANHVLYIAYFDWYWIIFQTAEEGHGRTPPPFPVMTRHLFLFVNPPISCIVGISSLWFSLALSPLLAAALKRSETKRLFWFLRYCYRRYGVKRQAGPQSGCAPRARHNSRTIESLESSSYNRSVAAVCFMLCRRCVPCSCIASPLAIFESRCLRMMPHSSPTPRAHRRAVLCSRREDVQPRKCHQTNNTTGRAPVRIFEQGATPGAYTVSPVGLRYWIPYDSNGRGECFRRNGRGCD